MAETNDGFEIARRDLEIRGPGEFLGARQSGAALLRFADLATDAALLDWARATAPRMLDKPPALAEKHVHRWLGTSHKPSSIVTTPPQTAIIWTSSIVLMSEYAYQ
jgi:RecG-like helicase